MTAGRRATPAGVLALAIVLAGALPVPGHALDHPEEPQEPEMAAPVDSLDLFLRILGDSTDVYFGESAAPPDTTHLDSLLAARLQQPWMPRRRRSGARIAPWVAFQRVDGPFYGAVARLGSEAGIGEVSLRGGYAAGSESGRGGAAYSKYWSRPRPHRSVWRATLSGGRFTRALDPDRTQDSWLRISRAFLNGSDRQSYYLREGLRAGIEHSTPALRLGAAFRADVEAPLVTTTTWTLLGGEPSRIDNLQAAPRRVHAMETTAAFRWPRLPVQTEAALEGAIEGLGSEAGYLRGRIAVAADFSLGDIVALIPQVQYGRLTGEVLPQASFYLGGSRSLRSLETNAFGGSGKGFARLDAIFVADLLTALRLPHPAALPIQGALFAASGAVWGPDPTGGPGSDGGAWPERGAWHSEVGASLLYRPGIPNPTGFLRLDFSRGVGPGGAQRVSIQYSTALDLVHPF